MTKQNKKGLYFLPLGGAAEIGMNLNLYAYDDQWLMVDLGVSFNDTMGVEVILPDPKFIAKQKEKLVGLLLTHAHEDHIGAIPYLWPQLQCPLYATPFTAHLIHEKLRDAGLAGQVEVNVIDLDGHQNIGPFDVQMVRLTHSIPEPNGVLIKSPAGSIFHTGDWKIDPDPLLGEPTDITALKKIGDDGVLAMVCDSTNVFNHKESGSEKQVLEGLREAIAKYPESQVYVGCFASNVARMQSIARAALENGRQVVAAGRSVNRMEMAARHCGYMKDIPEFLTPKAARKIPDSKKLVICTGSQGEARAALKRIANDTFSDLSLSEGDVVIFSSRVIPGNEKKIGALKNQLIRQGCHIITQHHHDIHVSGHPSQEELVQMYEWVRPQIAIPVHGELRHLVEHGRLAKKCGVPEVVICENGSLVRLSPGPVDVVQDVPSGRLFLDGDQLIATDHQAIHERQRLSENGLVVLTVVQEEEGVLALPIQVMFRGLVTDQECTDRVHEAAMDAYTQITAQGNVSDQKLRERLQRATQYVLKQLIGKRPEVMVSLVQG
ncbi:MAG: hypothetical protein C0582_03195 [Alphaproteobacteria bacterium]|nr:MAG: hypothetical protein C0582_03195 [Alphaproteobacteria bacterium]